jgi:hypothetical protein
VAERGVPAEPDRDAEHGEHDAQDEQPPPAQGRRRHGTGRGDQYAADEGPHDPSAPGGEGVRRERAGILDEPPAERPCLRARAERQQLAPPGGVAQAGDQRAQPGGPHPPHAEALRQRPPADPVDLQLRVPAGEQPAGGDERAAPADQAEPPVDDGGADHGTDGEQQEEPSGHQDDREAAGGEVGPVEVRPEPAGHLVEQAEQRPHGREGDGEVAADERCVQQPTVVEAAELLLRGG